MPRACVIVLDAVGAGELPDAAEYGDEGSNTLGNAAHEETIPLDELYNGCRIARQILTGKDAVGRVIARPFIGSPGNYERTPNRHDFSLEPRRPNYLTLVRDAGMKVYGVGKIGDIFAGQDIDESHPTKSDVGATVNRWLGGKAPSRGIPGQLIVEH